MKKPQRTLYIYIMYSKKINAYKIGESVAPERRLKEIQKGSAYGDSSTILVDKFPVDEKLLVHRAKRCVDEVFHLGINKRHKFPNAHYSEWFDISKEEAYLAIKKGFEKLKRDSDTFRYQKLKTKINRRFNYALNKVMKNKTKKEKVLRTFNLLNRAIDKCKTLEINLKIDVEDKSIEKFFKNHNRLYIDNLEVFNLIITTDIFLKGVLFVAEKYELSKFRFGKNSLLYAKKYHNLIMGKREYILNKIKNIRLVNDRYSTREPILRISSVLSWECLQFEQEVRDNSHLLSLEYYILYNLPKQNEDTYFYSLKNRYKNFSISL